MKAGDPFKDWKQEHYLLVVLIILVVVVKACIEMGGA